MSELIPTCFDVLNTPLYLSSSHLPQPYNNEESFAKSLRIFRNLGIDGVINMSIDSPIRPHHRKFYKMNKIDFFEIPIEDSKSRVLSNNFLNRIVKIYDAKKKINPDYTFLVHCSMGVNRSALVAGAILWARTSTKLTGMEKRPWETPLEMINWMKKCQIRDRKLTLLGNSYFEMHLRKWCYRQDNMDENKVYHESHVTRNGTRF